MRPDTGSLVLSDVLANASLGMLVTDAMLMPIGVVGSAFGVDGFGSPSIVSRMLGCVDETTTVGSMKLNCSSVNGHRWNSLLSTV